MNTTNQSDLAKFATVWSLTDEQVEQFSRFIDLLESWSQRTNLISRHDIDHIVFRHVEESLFYLESGVRSVHKMADIGSGGGFPAIPLKILFPDWDMVLIESKRMKALFLQEVVEHLNLKHITVINARAESLHLSDFDLVTARAVSSLQQLWVWARAWLSPSGCLVTLKGGRMDQEEQEFLSLYTDSSLRVVEISNRKLYIVQNA
jgi:16S rRNA (guanine527-N7)-methyltransferase